MRLLFTALLLRAVLATPLASSINDVKLAPLNAGGEHIDDQYIVVFKKGVDPTQIALHLAGVEGWHGSDVSDSVISSSGLLGRRDVDSIHLLPPDILSLGLVLTYSPCIPLPTVKRSRLVVSTTSTNLHPPTLDTTVMVGSLSRASK